jgi:hypothetical protein
MSINVKTVFLNALIFTTVNDLISGFSLDIFVPVIESCFDIRTPIKDSKIYLGRYMMRFLNFLIALTIFYILKST